MANVFISYSRKDIEAALRVRLKLQMQGVRGISLDIDPRYGLQAGTKWANALKQRVQSSKVVLVLLSTNWANSEYCWREYLWAKNVANGPMIIPLILENVDRGTPCAQPGSALFLENLLQNNGVLAQLGPQNWVSLQDVQKSDPDFIHRIEAQKAVLKDIWERLKAPFEKAGVEPEVLPFAADRPPYPGLDPLRREDAAVFFGREELLEKAVEQLESLRDQRSGPRFVTILGASGSGKSSFLRAGLIPRLELQDNQFYCLPPMRPNKAALSGNAEGLAATLAEAFNPNRILVPDSFAQKALEQHGGLDRTRGAARRAIEQGPEALEELLRQLQAIVSPKVQEDDVTPLDPVTLILPIDQGEELLPVEGAEPEQGGAEAALVRRRVQEILERRQVEVICIMAIRSDSFPRLQESTELGDLASSPINLPPMPEGSFRTIIEGPAEVLEKYGPGLDVEPALVKQLIDDAPGQDALPLIAFVLRRLYDGLAQKPAALKRQMTLADYEALGRIGGAIENVVDFSLGTKNLSRDNSKAAVALKNRLKAAFIPRLATVAERNGAFLRRIAEADEVAPFKDIIDSLVDSRILVRREEGQVEVAHEAVLREWRLLNGWLNDAKRSLWFLAQAEEAARQWQDGRAQKRRDGVAEGSAEMLDYDRSQLWPQERLNDVLKALDAVGQPVESLKEPLATFLRPEAERLLAELQTSSVGHQRRNEIGDRLAQLGAVEKGNTIIHYGDLRSGVNVLSLDRIENGWDKAPFPMEDRQRQHLDAFRRVFETRRDYQPVELPDIEWCEIPAGQVDVITQFDKETGEPDWNSAPTAFVIETPFFVSKYPVTLAQFQLFTGTGTEASDAYKSDDWWSVLSEGRRKWFNNKDIRDQSSAKNYPAQFVTWYQAVAYCRWLTSLYRSYGFLAEGAEVRLPFEHEWIQAATGGEKRLYPWGNDWNPDLCSNQDGLYRFVATGLYPRGAAPTGAMDMAGNMYEWCLNDFESLADPALDRDVTRATKGGGYFTFKRAGQVKWAMSVHHRLPDKPDGTNEGGNRIAAGIRLICTGFQG